MLRREFVFRHSPIPTSTFSKSWDRFALTVTFYVPGVCLLWYSWSPSGRFKDYQELFPPHPQEGFTDVQTSKKPSKTTTHLQESQVSEEDNEDTTWGIGKMLRRQSFIVSIFIHKTTALWVCFLTHILQRTLRLKENCYSWNLRKIFIFISLW